MLRRAARDQASGAAQIAERAAQALVGLPQEDVPRALRLLLTGHPSMAPLWRLASETLSGPDPAAGAERFLELLRSDAAAPEALGPRLPPWVLTISYSSTVVETLRRARLRSVSCMTSEPGGEGARMAGAVASFARVRVIEDDEALRLVPAAAVLMGADAISPAGLVNKVKSRALAEAASVRGVPVYAVAGTTKFVAMDLPLEGPFERIPFGLFAGIATPSGILLPEQTTAAAVKAILHPDLDSMLAQMRANPG
jgi:translation initiation factor eIF-2B subunit delta